MAGLPASKAWVRVGPPLLASGPSIGSITPLIGPPIRLPSASGEAHWGLRQARARIVPHQTLG